MLAGSVGGHRERIIQKSRLGIDAAPGKCLLVAGRGGLRLHLDAEQIDPIAWADLNSERYKAFRPGELSGEQDPAPIRTNAENSRLSLCRGGSNQRELLAVIAPGLSAEGVLKPSRPVRVLLDSEQAGPGVRNPAC